MTNPGSITSSATRSQHRSHTRRKDSIAPDGHNADDVNNELQVADENKDIKGFGDDFDEFEKGEEDAGEDDFGDFDEGFQEPTEEVVGDIVRDQSDSNSQQPPPLLSFVSSLSIGTNPNHLLLRGENVLIGLVSTFLWFIPSFYFFFSVKLL